MSDHDNTEQDSQAGNVESFAVHKLIKIAGKVVQDRKALKALADEADPALWPRVERQVRQNEKDHSKRYYEMLGKTERGTAKLAVLGFSFMSASAGIMIGQSVSAEQGQLLSQAFLFAVLPAMGGIAYAGYRSHKKLEALDRERPKPADFEVMRLVSEELRQKYGVIVGSDDSPEPPERL